MKTRSVPKQTKPYPVLTEVVKDQSVFEFEDVEGTIVGLRCPQYVDGLNVAGYHLHFLTSDLKAGGHVLELTTDDVTATLDYSTDFLMILPEMGSDFYRLDFSGDTSQAVNEVEK
jgi:acetolactate decarboxylase